MTEHDELGVSAARSSLKKNRKFLCHFNSSFTRRDDKQRHNLPSINPSVEPKALAAEVFAVSTGFHEPQARRSTFSGAAAVRIKTSPTVIAVQQHQRHAVLIPLYSPAGRCETRIGSGSRLRICASPDSGAAPKKRQTPVGRRPSISDVETKAQHRARVTGRRNQAAARKEAAPPTKPNLSANPGRRFNPSPSSSLKVWRQIPHASFLSPASPVQRYLTFPNKPPL